MTPAQIAQALIARYTTNPASWKQGSSMVIARCACVCQSAQNIVCPTLGATWTPVQRADYNAFCERFVEVNRVERDALRDDDASHTIFRYNDLPGTTVETIIQALRNVVAAEAHAP